jgi:hypothetical protein
MMIPANVFNNQAGGLKSRLLMAAVPDAAGVSARV